MAINKTLKEISHMWERGYFLLKMSESTSFKMVKAFRRVLLEKNKQKKKNVIPANPLFPDKMSDVTVFQTQLAFSSTVPCLVSQSVPPNVTEILFLYLTCSIYKYLGLKYFLSFFPLRSYVRTGGPSHVNCTSTSCKAAASVQWASGYVTERSPETTGIRHEVIQQLCLIPRKKKKKETLF